MVLPGGVNATFTQAAGSLDPRVTVEATNTFAYAGGTITGGEVTLNGATLRFPAAVSVPQGSVPTFAMTGISNKMSGDVPAGVTVQVPGTSSADGKVTVASGFTNAGTIVSDNLATTSRAVELELTSGTLTNAAGGVIRTADTGPGGGNPRILDVPALDNQGSLDIHHPLNLSGALANLVGTTLDGGTYDLAATLSVPNADINTNAATLILSGAGVFTTASGGNALADLAANSGDLTVRAGKVLTTTAAFVNSGTVTIEGLTSALQAAGYTQTAIVGAGTPQTNLGGGTVRASSGTGTVDIQDGLLSGEGTVDGDLLNAGFVIPGASPGRITVTGTSSQGAAGHLDVEVGGLIAGTQYDQLSVAEVATLGGELAVSLIPGFVPQVDDRFAVVTGATRTGSFATEDLAPLTGGLAFEVVYTTTGVDLLVVDVQAPTWPAASLAASDITETTLTLDWSAATDNVAVDEYLVFQGTTQIGTVTAPTETLDVTGLSPSTSYAFSVQADDAADNRSTTGPSTTATRGPAVADADRRPRRTIRG